MAIIKRSKILISRLRIEEIIPLFFFIPSFLFTLKANLYFYYEGLAIPKKFYGGFTRLGVTLLLMGLYYYLLNRYRNKPFFKWIRNTMPFLFCIAIYTNMHDTIGFINPHDVHFTLIHLDKLLFGVEPTVWAQQFYRPWLTDYFSISYMNYFLIAVAVVVFLIIKKRDADLRTVLLGTILTFYMGYFLYILFPAAPPRLVLANQFVRDFSGGWFTAAQNRLININPSSSRAAFPSLHCAITLISLIYAYKNSKVLFWVLLIPGISLVLATVYLRHHYVVDILAGFALAIFVYFVSPAINRWWEHIAANLAARTGQFLR